VLLNALALGWAISMLISSTLVPRLLIDGAISFLDAPGGGVYGDPDLVRLALADGRFGESLPPTSRSLIEWATACSR
jgi:hypothetical protein